ncbi:MAG TPA: SOS response-associated peptidase [Solirubrobacteraceae bacterium]|nr:SOS response-associated peptidase [Solirubrobacteraceae bacterium]
MCGRYTLAGTDPSQLRSRWPVGERVEVRRRFNVAPGDDVLAVLQRPGEPGPHGTLLRWGLVPFWASDPKELGLKTINARAETVAERPAYRDAFESRRCLILADGFYEWSGGVPHWITRDDGEPFAFAGLWASWRPKGASRDVEPLRSCSIVTTAAAGPMRALHDRMPVILAGVEQESLWIGRDTPADQLHALCRPESAPALEFRPVSRAVNDARFDGPECLNPPEQASLF